jgi:hypothetical protein
MAQLDVLTYRDNLVRAIRRGESLETIEALTRLCPQALTATDVQLWAPLHNACDHSLICARLLCLLIDLEEQFRRKKTITAGMVDRHGNTPLHLACQSSRTSLDALRVLIRAYPEALQVQNYAGKTPLACACDYLRKSPPILEFLVQSCPPPVLGQVDPQGWMPLHHLVLHGVSNQVMSAVATRMHPHALTQMAKTTGMTVLHLACSGFGDIETLSVLMDKCPVALLLLAQQRKNSPLSTATMYRSRETKIIYYMQEATKDAVCALVDVILSDNPAVPPPVKAHIQDTITNADDIVQPSNTHRLRDRMDIAMLASLLRYDELQDMLSNQDCKQNLLDLQEAIHSNFLSRRRVEEEDTTIPVVRGQDEDVSIPIVRGRAVSSTSLQTSAVWH